MKLKIRKESIPFIVMSLITIANGLYSVVTNNVLMMALTPLLFFITLSIYGNLEIRIKKLSTNKKH